MPKVTPSFSSTVKDTWMKNISGALFCYDKNHKYDKVSKDISPMVYIQRKASKYLLEIDVLKTNKNVRTSKVEFALLSFWKSPKRRSKAAEWD